MVQVIDTGGTFGQQFGKGLGEGLSAQIPKEIERVRLSKGLENLSQQDLSSKNQLQMLAQIANIPGITPDLANLALQQVQKQNFLQRQPSGIGTQRTPTGQNILLPTIRSLQNEPSKEALETEGFGTPAQLSQYKKSLLQEPSFEQTKALADEYLVQNLTQNPQEALNFAKQELTQNRQAQQARNQALRSDLNSRITLNLQGQGLGDYKDVPGEIQNKLIDQGEYMVNVLGLTPEAASEQISQIATNMGKSINSLKDTGSFWNIFRKSSKKTQELKSQREVFSKYGFGELFDDMASGALGITSLQAAHILDPVKNKQITSSIDKLKKYPVRSDKQLKRDQLDQIVRNIKPSDNIFDIQYLLREKGYDPNQIKKGIEEAEENGFIALTDQQKRQQRRPISSSFLGDVFYQSF